MTNSSINKLTVFDLEDFGLKPTMHNYQRIATKSAIYPGKGTVLGLSYCALKLNGEAGELAEHIGKAMRDDKLFDLVELDPLVPKDSRNFSLELNQLTPERLESIIKEIGDVLWYLSAICNELGINLSSAAETNLEKLYLRTERDTLRGSGDNR